MAGEFEFIEWVRSQHREPAEGSRGGGFVVVPPGDDLAALRWAADDLLLVGVDQALDGVHFDAAVHPPRLIGRKVMNRNLSDCAAMACLPAAAVATAALPRGGGGGPSGGASGGPGTGPAGLDYAKELYLGMSEAGAKFNCPIVGGDTATWDGRLALTVTILGRSAGVKPIVRCCARPGDGIYVTGPLGGSILGRHLTFEPRVDTARKLASLGGITAMIDISDGLSRDLGHVCRQSGVGAVVVAAQVPVHEDAIAMRRDGRTALDHALHDGEDYELLFTGPPAFYFASTRVGTITQEPGVWLQTSGGGREPLEPQGWEHRL